jgi:hypothetical protein
VHSRLADLKDSFLLSYLNIVLDVNLKLALRWHHMDASFLCWLTAFQRHHGKAKSQAKVHRDRLATQTTTRNRYMNMYNNSKSRP